MQGNLLPQKAKHYHLEKEKRSPHYVGKEYMVFEKHDGWYGYIDPGDVVRSRQQRAIPSLEWMAPLFEGLKGRLIFEVLVRGMPKFSDLNGYLNRKQPGPRAYVLVHDYLVPGNFDTRFTAAAKYVMRLSEDSIAMANSLCVAKEPYWQTIAEQQWALGREGIVMKDMSAEYTAGSRIGSLLKIKEELTLDLLVTGVIEGEGKYEGMLGALRVREANGQEHVVSGMTDERRVIWWDKPSTIVGLVVEIKAMKRLSNGSLREPRFKAIRHDKGREDID